MPAGSFAADPTPVSSPNWSGYAATGPAGTAFTSVTGTWVAPAVRCSGGPAGAAAMVWVGIGGYGEGAREVEQVGTNASCRSSPRPLYYAWFEIAPFPAVPIPSRVRAGDVMTASVDIGPLAVELRITDRSRSWTFARTITSVLPDTSSAEWIVEAPANCGLSACSRLPLANFGSVTMTGIAASGAGSGWTLVPIQLLPDAGMPRGAMQQLDAESIWTTGTAVPGPISPDGTAFTVSWITVTNRGRATG